MHHFTACPTPYSCAPSQLVWLWKVIPGGISVKCECLRILFDFCGHSERLCWGSTQQEIACMAHDTACPMFPPFQVILFLKALFLDFKPESFCFEPDMPASFLYFSSLCCNACSSLVFFVYHLDMSLSVKSDVVLPAINLRLLCISGHRLDWLPIVVEAVHYKNHHTWSH